MASTFTSASIVTHIDFWHDVEGRLAGLTATDGDGDRHLVDGGHGYTVWDPDNVDADSVLGILRAKWADGTLGDPTYTFHQDRYGFTHPDQLEPRGFLNPLDADSYGRWFTTQKVRGAFQQEATVARDADTGRPDIKGGIGWVPESRVPDGTLNQSLEDWRLVSNGINFTWRLDLTEEDAPTDAEFTAPAPIQALLEWWAGLRDFGGFNVNTSAVTRAEFLAAIAGSRVYALEQSTGSSVGWHVFALVTSNGNRTIEIVCQWSSTSDEHDAQAINDILNSTAIEIETEHPVEEAAAREAREPVAREPPLSRQRTRLDGHRDRQPEVPRPRRGRPRLRCGARLRSLHRPRRPACQRGRR